jgi:hypothetical protein
MVCGNYAPVPNILNLPAVGLCCGALLQPSHGQATGPAAAAPAAAAHNAGRSQSLWAFSATPADLQAGTDYNCNFRSSMRPLLPPIFHTSVANYSHRCCTWSSLAQTWTLSITYHLDFIARPAQGFARAPSPRESSPALVTETSGGELAASQQCVAGAQSWRPPVKSTLSHRKRFWAPIPTVPCHG